MISASQTKVANIQSALADYTHVDSSAGNRCTKSESSNLSAKGYLGAVQAKRCTLRAKELQLPKMRKRVGRQVAVIGAELCDARVELADLASQCNATGKSVNTLMVEGDAVAACEVLAIGKLRAAEVGPHAHSSDVTKAKRRPIQKERALASLHTKNESW